MHSALFGRNTRNSFSLLKSACLSLHFSPRSAWWFFVHARLVISARFSAHSVANKNRFASESGQCFPRRLLVSIVAWLVAMHAHKQNFWTNRFGWARWARHKNDYDNAHCTRTLSSPCYMRFIWHNGRRHSFLICELSWDNGRQALMHTSLMVAAPEFVNYRDWNKPLLFWIFTVRG